MPESTPSAMERRRASLGTDSSTVSAETENVRYRSRMMLDTPSAILSLRMRLYSAA